MTRHTLLPALALLASGITASGLVLTSVPAQAATTHQGKPAAHADPQGGVVGKPLTPSQLSSVRAEQRQLAATSTVPTFSKAGSTTFAVDTTEDSDLADPAGTSCVDADTGRCSLRAAVDAANNLNKPVRIVLGKHTYTLNLATQLSVSNHHGTSIVGNGAGKTAIAGDGSGLFFVTTSSAGPAALLLKKLTLKNGSDTHGGAIETDSDGAVALNLDRVVARDNTATSRGGAVYADSGTSLYISHSSFTKNHSPGGGALYQYWSDVTIVDTTFTDNDANGSASEGGAIYNEYGVFDMTGGAITGNTAGDATHRGVGGGLEDSFATSSLSGVHVDHNTARSSGTGGGIFAVEDELSIDHGTISHNHVDGSRGSGGGIDTNFSTQLTLEHARMVGNRAGGRTESHGGGAIFVHGDQYPAQLTVDHSRITGSNASAIYLWDYYAAVDASITHSTLSDNVSTVFNGHSGLGCGGAVCAYSHQYGPINLRMQNDQVTGNVSVGDGSAGAVMQYAYLSAPSSAALSHNTFADNRSGAGGYGGAVGFYTDTAYYAPISVRMSANTFTRNRAGTQASPGYGGAVSAFDAVTLADKGSHFSRNHAVGDGAEGGAVADLTGDGSATFTRSTFTHNTAGTNHAGNAGFGGAIYTSTLQGTVLDEATISGNRSGSDGGGLYADTDSYQVTITASTVSGNSTGSRSTTGHGGGIYTEDSVMTVQNSTVTGNHANGSHGSGGGIYYAGGRTGLRYSTVSGNVAERGGGLYGVVNASVLASIISRNRSSAHGSESDCAVSAPTYRPASYGFNVLGQRTCVVALAKGDTVSKHPGLGGLKDNGGPTRTMAISAQSPAAGRAMYLVPSTDQRGHARPAKHADAGAFELPRGHRHH